MPVMDEFREEREALKHGTPKQKWQYFKDYYRWPVIVGVIVVIMVISLIRQIVVKKDEALYAVFLNCYTTEEASADLLEDFSTTAEINTDKAEAVIDSSLVLTDDFNDSTSYLTLQKMTVYLASRQIDALAADINTFNHYAYNKTMRDLREVLSPQQQALYEPYYLYIDGKVLEEQQAALENLEEYTASYPDPTKPEEMTDPIPVALCLDHCKKLENHFEFFDQPVALGIIANAPRTEMALKFIDYLFEEVGE